MSKHPSLGSDFPDQNVLWADRTQTTVQTIVRLWSDPNSDYKHTMIWSDHLQTMVQTQFQTIAHTLIRLWSDSSALKTVWSEKDFIYEQIS